MMQERPQEAQSGAGEGLLDTPVEGEPPLWCWGVASAAGRAENGQFSGLPTEPLPPLLEAPDGTLVGLAAGTTQLS